MSNVAPRKIPSRTRIPKTTSPSVPAAANDAVLAGNGDGVRPLLPIAKWMGFIELARATIDCYVLEDGRRVLSINGAVRALAGLETGHGRLDKYIGVTALRPFIDAQAVMDGLIDFEIPGSNNNFGNARGLSTDAFETIMGAFIDAMEAEASFTDNQRKMAIRCAVLSRGLVRTGLTALVDEATGYQKVRSDDDLQVKLKAFIASELRPYEKTFPDDLWIQFGRLTGWKDSLKNRPRYWGKLVIRFIYNTLDEDVAKYLKENRPPKGVMWHQQLTENYGVRMLVTRCIEVTAFARTCTSMQQLAEMVALHFGKQPVQFSLSGLMNEKQTVGMTERLARDLRRKAREAEVARVIPSYAAGQIGQAVQPPRDELLIAGMEPEQPTLLDALMMSLPDAPEGEVWEPVPEEIAEILRASELGDEERGFVTAHEKLATGHSIRRPKPSDDRVVPTRFGEKADADQEMQDLLDLPPAGRKDAPDLQPGEK